MLQKMILIFLFENENLITTSKGVIGFLKIMEKVFSQKYNKKQHEQEVMI
jgi:hypothetical protein